VASLKAVVRVLGLGISKQNSQCISSSTVTEIRAVGYKSYNRALVIVRHLSSHNADASTAPLLLTILLLMQNPEIISKNPPFTFVTFACATQENDKNFSQDRR
jgi:hypothetical protein